MDTSSPLHLSAEYVESMYELYQQDPDAVDVSWKFFFDGMRFVTEQGVMHLDGQPDTRIANLIRGYRKWGHLYADLDPLGVFERNHDQLDLKHYAFSEADFEREFPTAGFLQQPRAKLSELVDALEKTYCSDIGLEYVDGSDLEREKWFMERIEPNYNQPDLDIDTKTEILKHLNEAELFERFLHTKYVGQKRFSLEGAEGLIPALSEMIESLATHDADEIIIGMPHRGRLNVLANIMDKTLEEMFSEFEPNYLTGAVQGAGDVKYHKGFVSDYLTRNKEKIHITLVDNPSHLEAVCPVVQGLARGNQDMRDDVDQHKIVPILIHGDAAFAGQGIVPETLNMSQLEGYRTGGTIHIVVNNQIGFTTDPQDSRSTVYCSDVARQINAPVFHVNGENPEALVHCVRIAAEFRQKFHQDVVIDMVCYRRHGHNEGDEPSFTQPIMYKKINGRPSVRKVYVDQLIAQGQVQAKVARGLEKEFQQRLLKALEEARSDRPIDKNRLEPEHYHEYKQTTRDDFYAPVDTAVPEKELLALAKAMTAIPEGFHPHKKVARLMEDRLKMVKSKKGIDWGTGEYLAYASLLAQGIHCRLSGQDVRRGTFSHRHAVIYDGQTSEAYFPLNNIKEKQGRFYVYNSHLSELAVLGFEFGYSLSKPSCLVIWEAQFGDFCNGAQIIIDQFISSSESKWNRVSDLVMFLPHGFEGQGPEHSSARLERFLQLSGQSNIQVANLTEPAQLFHILRRQVLRDFRKPLVIMTPKSLLRSPDCVSELKDFSEGRFQELIPDPVSLPKAECLLFCSGKIYVDLKKEREKRGIKNVAIARVEQLYPFAKHQAEEIVASYPKLKEIRWVQEEPENMGAWWHINPYFRKLFPKLPLEYIGRIRSASPAVGSLSLHHKEQADLIERALNF